MAQASPTYGYAVGKAEKPIIDFLIRKYGPSNVTWPIVLIDHDRTVAYLYEKNGKNGINALMDSRPGSRSRLPSFYLDYTANPRAAVPAAGFLKPFLEDRYACSYDYIVDSPFSTVDLDYVWYNGSGYKGFEFTTFYMDFYSHDRARNLIAQMHKRPSWQGAAGAHAFYKIAESAEDLGVDYYMVCANTTDRVGSSLKTDGNVCLFPFSRGQAERIQAGRAPENTMFMTFREFLRWL